MLVLWALALRGGRLWVRRRSGRPTTPAGAIEVDQAAAVVV
jgi:hypothetical protein